jgi:Na+/H+ antiporter NhaD/arsenite permease-like protein
VNEIALLVFVGTLSAVVARQLLGKGPGIWAILSVGGLLMVGTGALALGAAAQTLDSELPVFAFLLALFLFASALDEAGAIDHLARWIVHRERHLEELPFALFIGFGVLSTILLNDAVVLVGVPLFLTLARRIRRPAAPLLYTLMFAVTVGSVLTPMGNPQNLLVAIGSGLQAPVAEFLRYLLLPTAINLVLGGLYLRWRLRDQLTRVDDGEASLLPLPLLPKGGWPRRILGRPVLLLFPLTMGLVVGSSLWTDLTGEVLLPFYWIALAGAAALLAITPGRAPILKGIDWRIILLFAGLFVVVAGAVSAGAFGAIQRAIPVPSASGSLPLSEAIIAGSSLGATQLLSNVPWVALEIPVLHSLGYGAQSAGPWLALAAGSTLAGSLTFLGAASNLIVVEEAERQGVRLRLSEFVRLGAPLVAMTVSILLVCLALGI